MSSFEETCGAWEARSKRGEIGRFCLAAEVEWMGIGASIIFIVVLHVVIACMMEAWRLFKIQWVTIWSYFKTFRCPVFDTG